MHGKTKNIPAMIYSYEIHISVFLSSVLWAQLYIWVWQHDWTWLLLLCNAHHHCSADGCGKLFCWFFQSLTTWGQPPYWGKTISILPHMLKDQHLRQDHHQHHYQGYYTTWPLRASRQKSSKSKDHRSLVFLYNLQQKPLLCDFLKFSWYFD